MTGVGPAAKLPATHFQSPAAQRRVTVVVPHPSCTALVVPVPARPTSPPVVAGDCRSPPTRTASGQKDNPRVGRHPTSGTGRAGRTSPGRASVRDQANDRSQAGVSAITPSTMCSSTRWPCAGEQADERPCGVCGEPELPAVVKQRVPLAVRCSYGVSRRGSKIFWLLHGLEGVVELAGDVALEAADDLGLG